MTDLQCLCASLPRPFHPLDRLRWLLLLSCHTGLCVKWLHADHHQHFSRANCLHCTNPQPKRTDCLRSRTNGDVDWTIRIPSFNFLFCSVLFFGSRRCPTDVLPTCQCKSRCWGSWGGQYEQKIAILTLWFFVTGAMTTRICMASLLSLLSSAVSGICTTGSRTYSLNTLNSQAKKL